MFSLFSYLPVASGCQLSVVSCFLCAGFSHEWKRFTAVAAFEHPQSKCDGKNKDAVPTTAGEAPFTSAPRIRTQGFVEVGVSLRMTQKCASVSKHIVACVCVMLSKFRSFFLL